MSIETEIKAHVDENMVENVKSKLLSIPSCVDHGNISKFDIYWSTSDDGDPIFRTRKELDNGRVRVLFTAKPHKKKSARGTENNEEFEFEASGNQWDRILEFANGTGYKVCRVKWKKGWHCTLMHNGFEVHAELLEVKYLGWFLEMEICSEESNDDALEAEDRALREILSFVGLNEDSVESLGYNKMLRAIGHEKG